MSVTISDLKLSAQRALLGNVSQNLRGVCVDVSKNIISIHFYYDGSISESDRESSEHAIDQILGDVFDPSLKEKMEFRTPIKRIDYPQKMPLIGHWVYYRKED